MIICSYIVEIIPRLLGFVNFQERYSTSFTTVAPLLRHRRYRQVEAQSYWPWPLRTSNTIGLITQTPRDDGEWRMERRCARPGIPLYRLHRNSGAIVVSGLFCELFLVAVVGCVGIVEAHVYLTRHIVPELGYINRDARVE